MALEGGLPRARRAGRRKDFEMLAVWREEVAQAGGVAGWCALRGSEVAACLEEAGCGEAVVGGVRKMVVRWRK